MKILILGSGGREHALCFRLGQDPQVTEVLVYPGNPGMSGTPKTKVCDGEVTLSGLLKLIKLNQIDLVVIGPEKYLFEGYVDELKAAGIPVFGPTREASFLEESKIKSKNFMKEFGIPTSSFETATSLDELISKINDHPLWAGYVLKLSGPALGKGVIVTRNASEATDAARQFFLHRPLGIEEGIVLEEKVRGREVSLFYICDGENYRFLASACDHKKLKNNDEGPNTGGMGAYSPCTWIDSNFLNRVEQEVLIPSLKGMSKRGAPFTGILFLGLMVQGNQYYLLEYNTRLGDPETQAFLPIFNGNLTEILYAASIGKLAELTPQDFSTHDPKFALHVVKAAKGYPGIFGEEIEAGKLVSVSEKLKTLKNTHLFCAGLKENGKTWVTNGGRVLGITGVGNTLLEARDNAYLHLNLATFSGEQFRTDIGDGA